MTEMAHNFSVDVERTSSGEVPFHVNEMFFSRTDKRAVIRSGNTVFQRLAGFDWDELIGAPHKVIRHQDMPKGIFKHLFNEIEAGRPIGFYEKNREKSGRYYWVFSLVAPIKGGYLSTRIKPTTDFLPKISEIYARIGAKERDEGLQPQESCELLIEEIKGLGFVSYDAFQATALAREIEARTNQMGGALDQEQKRFLDMSRGIQQVWVETNEMKDAFKAIRTVPMNMRIIASRLENAGGPISAISVNYSQMLEEMTTWVKTFVDGDDCVFASMRNAILTGQFLAFASGIKGEMAGTLRNEVSIQMDGVDFAKDAEMIEALRKEFREKTTDALGSVENEARRFGRSVLDMKRYVTGLSSTRMMCKIESASLNNSGTTLSGIVDQLDACQDEIENRLAKIVELNSAIQGNTSMLRSLL